MGLVRGLIKAGIAKKVIDEARKPKNQQKAKELYAKLRDRRTGGGSSDPGSARGAGKSTPPRRPR